jgi:hypothetical protein
MSHVSCFSFKCWQHTHTQDAGEPDNREGGPLDVDVGNTGCAHGTCTTHHPRKCMWRSGCYILYH